MKEIIFRHECIILDACCIINLYASGKMLDILKVVQTRFAVTDYVADNEALTIYSDIRDDTLCTKVPIDLHPFLDTNLLTVVSPNCEEEYIDCVNFACELDDGEAFTGAIAKHRNWAIGTDERKGINFFTKETPQIQLISTPELVKCWADIVSPPSRVIGTAVRNIERCAKYRPSKNHPLFKWWENNKKYQ